MYEQHFGLSGHPFAATPDPDFYFDSAGHRRALAYLRHAVLEGESFVVMTGDIGAGKTTLLHKLLRGLDGEAIVSALLAGTRLDAAALLVAVLSAWRAPANGPSLDRLRAHLRAFLATLTSTGRRALIVVDEAQHLLPDAIAELTTLAQLQSSRGAPLQVVLCGEPALRSTLQGTPAVAMRQPVFLYCDVGLLSPLETRAYIEHRLRHVGWAGSPSFADEAYDLIHQASDGVPRRVNRLCDRLLMAACQLELDTITAELVDRTSAELREELGGLGAAPAAAAAAIPQALPAAGADHLGAPAQGIIPALFRTVGDEVPAATAPAAPPVPDAPEPAMEPTGPKPATPEPTAPESADPGFAMPASAWLAPSVPGPVAPALPEPRLDIVRAPRGARAGARWAAASAAVLVAALSTAWWAQQRKPVAPPATAPRAAAGNVTTQPDGAAEAARSRELADIAPGTLGAPSAGPSMPAPVTSTPPPPPAPPPPSPTAQAPAPPAVQTDAPRAEPAPPAVRPARRPGAPRNRRAEVETESAPISRPTRAADADAPQPAPAPGPCTAAVAALGLCNPTKNNP